MIKKLIEYFKNKKILILGFGREGQSTYKLLRKFLPEQVLYIADKKEDLRESFDFLAKDENLVLISGEKYLDNLDKYDVIMKTPGISLKDLDVAKFRDKIKSQLELLLEFFNVLTIGVTGTKGKSTTSSLIYKVLTDQNKKSLLLGNIGTPIFDRIEEVDQDSILVLEMSSHQLEYMSSSPNIAILLNVYEEHLDHYKSFNEYANAKCNIFRFQKPDDYFLYNYDDEVLNAFIKEPTAQTLKISLNNKIGSDIYLAENEVYFKDKPVYDKNDKRTLLGDHNLNDIMFVVSVSEILKLDLEKTRQSINEFKTLEHRMEFVGKFDDVLYYNNSIATIPKATIEAINALKEVDTLIIGGMDRSINYDDFIEFLNSSEVDNIICMPKTGHDIAKKLKPEKRYIVETLEEAVKIAKEVTKKDKICLLSPTAASYGFFKNFEEKGDLYKSLVRNML